MTGEPDVAFAASLDDVGAALLSSWSDPRRRYHDIDHLRDILGYVDMLAGDADDGCLAVRNLVPATPLRGRWAAAHAGVAFSATFAPFDFYRDTLGLRAFKSQDLELDIGVAGAFGSRADDIDARRGMPDLGTLVEFGPRLTWKLGEAAGGRWRVQLPVRGVYDLSDGGAQRGVSFEPELQFERGTASGWRYSTSVSAVFANRKLADTFYGVAPRYATATRPAYQAESGLVAWRYGLVERDATYLDLVAGVRAWSARVRMAYAVPVPTPPPIPQQYAGGQSHRWVDAQVGVKGRHGFGNGMFVGGWVLAGAGESALSTDAMLLAGYDINDRFAVIAGYRRLSTDFKTSGGFRFDATMQGPGLGMEYRF